MDRSARAHGWGLISSDPVRSAQTIVWRHPEWWSIALSAMAWAVLLARIDIAAFGSGDAAEWLLMVVAMMVPLVVGPLRATAARSLWSRRNRAMAAFLVGYLGIWIAAGIMIVIGIDVLAVADHAHSSAGVAAAFGMAAVWQRTSRKRRAANACHRTIPLAARGWRASRDSLKYGSMIGTHCLVSCWALMLACFMAHSVTMMMCVAAVGAADRYLSRRTSEAIARVIPLLAVFWTLNSLRG